MDIGNGEHIEDPTAYIEQAEYIPPENFLAWTIDHPREQEIIRKLCSGGAKLLVGPRGCGKTTLMLKSWHKMAGDKSTPALPVYVNFKLSLKLEPLYQTTPNATFWFRTWLILKIYDALHDACEQLSIEDIEAIPTRDEITLAILTIESGDPTSFNKTIEYQTDELKAVIDALLNNNGLSRCILLLDDAAHAFSPKQQEDFFDFFRRIKSTNIAPKAAIYPGITSHSASFHVGHDAEKIDVWIRPDTPEYVSFMRQIAHRRLGENLLAALDGATDIIPFLAYAAFGIPRSFLNMLRIIESEMISGNMSIDRRKVLDAAKQSKQDAHAVFDSLVYKIPVYKNFIHKGQDVYNYCIAILKEFNKNKNTVSNGFEIGLKRPMPPELSRVIGFYQYAGLMMPVGENSRGEKGVFDIYFIHFADLITENAIVGRRSKSLSAFNAVFSSRTHLAYPRITAERLIGSGKVSDAFPLSLPPCQSCGAERANEDAKFCINCGSELKTASLYHALIAQDISVLPITKARSASIKKHSSLKTIKDMLLDNTKEELRSVPQIGPKWAERIARYAQEYVA